MEGSHHRHQVRLHLPAELICNIFVKLDFRSRVTCQGVCKAWNVLLAKPTSKVWDEVCLDVLSLDLLEDEPRAALVPEFVKRFSPIRRWLTARHRGISKLSVSCECCEDCSTVQRCEKDRKWMAAFFGCLLTIPVDISLKFSCASRRHLLGTTTSFGPLRDLSARLVQLDMHCPIERIKSLGLLKRLRQLAFKVTVHCVVTQEDLHALGTLSALQELSILFDSESSGICGLPSSSILSYVAMKCTIA
ncbi:hypothetical protein WJX73_005531 [Symbiochloris irregularis]|uniref:F-box domain-containing protein n=1 Tax=Symbiochloris irregularis TaxID=706552 RepID=A0AAW1NKN6_9CHLO